MVKKSDLVNKDTDSHYISPTDSTRLNKGFTQTKGYYTIGFTTKIRRATSRDEQLKLSYGIELVCSYHKVIPRLVYLVLKTENNTISSVEEIYYVMLGKIIMGKLVISTQKVASLTNIIYVYKYKDTPLHFKKYNLNAEDEKALGKSTQSLRGKYNQIKNNRKRSSKLQDYKED